MTVTEHFEISRLGVYNSKNGYMVENPRDTRLASRGGIKHWDGVPFTDVSFTFTSSGVTVEDLRDTSKVKERVWRPEETLEAARILGEKGRLMIVGDPQAGKGSILYGISSICDIGGISYTMIDGHWLDTSGERVVEAIQNADQNRSIIFYDSFDYLLAGTRAIRKTSAQAHEARTQTIISALEAAQVPLVLTVHGQTWRDYFLSQDLLEKHKPFFSGFEAATYFLPRQMASEISRHIFLVDHEYSDHEARALLNLAKSEAMINALLQASGSKQTIEALRMALQDFPTLKFLARERSAETRNLIRALENGDNSAPEQLYRIIMESFHTSNFLANLRKLKN